MLCAALIGGFAKLTITINNSEDVAMALELIREDQRCFMNAPGEGVRKSVPTFARNNQIAIDSRSQPEAIKRCSNRSPSVVESDDSPATVIDAFAAADIMGTLQNAKSSNALIQLQGNEEEKEINDDDDEKSLMEQESMNHNKGKDDRHDEKNQNDDGEGADFLLPPTTKLSRQMVTRHRQGRKLVIEPIAARPVLVGSSLPFMRSKRSTTFSPAATSAFTASATKPRTTVSSNVKNKPTKARDLSA